LGLWHPQEGIVNGHFKSSSGEKVNIIGQLRYGCAKWVEDTRYVPDGSKKFAVADMITGYGVAESIRHYYEIYHNNDLKGKTAIIQGWGNVASTAASYLTLEGVKIKGIIDKDGGLISTEGLGLEEIKALFLGKKGNKLHAEDLLSFGEVNEKIWSIGADIFIPGAASKLVTRNQIDQMIAGGLEVISCGANVPFVDDEIFFGPTATYTDQQISLIPDFIANCGMARVFAYLMQKEALMTDEAIFSDVSQTIQAALKQVHLKNPGNTGISTSALEISLGKLLAQPTAEVV
ncbi:MAG: amino acid dehydrogenase, partial [Bacteroidota bacterium]